MTVLVIVAGKFIFHFGANTHFVKNVPTAVHKLHEGHYIVF